MATTNYFNELSTVEDIKAHYRMLARKYHPDLGGDQEIMKTINLQYHQALKLCNGKQSDGYTYKYSEKIEQEIIDKINELLKMDGIEINLVGTWLWISGNTKPVKDKLKALGCWWNSSRGLWYWKPKSFGKTRSNPGSLDQLAIKYGCQNFRSKDTKILIEA